MEFEIRSIESILLRMHDISESLKDDIPDDLIEKYFKETLSLMLEIRVPRMPETKEELRVLLEDAMSGESYSSEEVFRRLREHARSFNSWKEDYNQAVMSHDFKRAAKYLIKGEPGPSWQKLPEITYLDSGICRLNADSILFETRHNDTALLGALLILHKADPSSWKRR